MSAELTKRPVSVSVVAILNLWYAFLAFILALLVLASPAMMQGFYGAFSTAMGVVLLLEALVFLVGGIGVLNRQDWARYLLIVLSGLSLIGLLYVFITSGQYFELMPQGTMILMILILILFFLLHGCTIFFLLTPAAAQYFRRLAPPPPPPPPLPPPKPEKKAIAWLLVQTGPDQGKEFRLSFEGDYSIGKPGASVKIPLNDKFVSRQHARIRWEGGAFVLHDMGSMNHTFVNGERIDRHLLNDGDSIQVGETVLRFSYPGIVVLKAQSAGETIT